MAADANEYAAITTRFTLIHYAIGQYPMKRKYVLMMDLLLARVIFDIA